MRKQKLRIGLLLDDIKVSRWFYKMIEIIEESDYAEVVLIVKRQKNQAEKESFFTTLWKNRSTFLFLLYLKLEHKLFKTKNDAFAKENLSQLLDCPELVVKTKETKFSDRFEKEDLAKIEQFKIDVLIRSGFKILRGGILTIAKYGVWSYHHGDNLVNRGGPAGAWEVLEGWDKTGVILQILTEDLDGGVKLTESHSRTDYLSIRRNKNRYYWKALQFIPRKLKELSEIGSEEFFERVNDLNSAPLFYSNRLFKAPKNGELLSSIFQKGLSAIKTRLNGTLYFKQWILLFKFEKTDQMSKSFFRFKRMIPPKDRFWADPFVVFRNNKYYIFLEELEYKTGKGNISVIEMDEKGHFGPSKIILDTDYHLSYPFIFEDNEELYMIPESSQNKSIELYKCTEFPLKWELQKKLFDNIMATDSTILRHEGKYWLFASIRQHHAAPSDDELFLFYSDSLSENQWTPHPMNPIVSDVEYARPAGHIFEFKGKLYRPSQNGSKGYGYGIQIREIQTLTETEYNEVQIQSIHPNWDKDLFATHTLNHANKLTVIDALVKRKRFF